MNFYRIADTSDENLAFDVHTPQDPTGLPSFGTVTAGGAVPSSYTDGTWAAAYADGKRQALTPLLPATLALSAGSYDLYLQWTAGSETIIRHVAVVEVYT